MLHTISKDTGRIYCDGCHKVIANAVRPITSGDEHYHPVCVPEGVPRQGVTKAAHVLVYERGLKVPPLPSDHARSQAPFSGFGHGRANGIYRT